MKKYKYGIIGSFVIGKNTYGGQSIKTRNFTEALETKIGKENVFRVDTYGWKKHPFRLIFNILGILNKSEEIVILPADRGVLVIPRLVKFLRGFRKIKLHYVVIGGWLPEFLLNRKTLSRVLKKYDGIYVETNSMKTALECQGFTNIYVLPNFKKLHILEENELIYPEGYPLRLCTFSRVMKEKGIEDAINAVIKANEKLQTTAFSLDIYGQVDGNYETLFTDIKKSLPSYIKYMGMADGSKSTSIIKNYFVLLFPTYFYGEGYPGTLLDAFSAGVPTIASDWRYNGEIVGGDKGLLHEPKNVEALADLLVDVYQDMNIVISKKENCLNYAVTMTPENIIEIFCKS